MVRLAGGRTPEPGVPAGQRARPDGEPRPLLSAGARPPALAVAAICAVLIAALGTWFRHQSRPDALDRAAFGWLLRHRVVHHSVLEVLAWLGTAVPVTVAVGLIAAACLARRRWRGAVLAVTSVAVASGLTELALKPLVGRTFHGWLSFPSGRATGAFSVAAVCAVLLLPGPARPRRLAARLAAVLAAVAVACAVADAAVILQLHYLTDVLGGAAVGTGTVLLAALVIDWVSPRAHALIRRPGAG